MSAPEPLLARAHRLALAAPDRVAVEPDEAPPVTRGALLARAGVLGDALRAHGVLPDGIVGIDCAHSVDHVVAMLGAWLAGAAFVPLDPRWPAARRAFVLRDAGARVLVARANGGDDGVRVLAAPGAEADRAPLRAPPAYDAERLAYLIYTSGSTGEPRGVRVAHRGIGYLLDAQTRAFALDQASRSLWTLSPAFDASVSDVGCALYAGATLCLAPPAALEPGEPLLRTFAARAISHVDLPPSVLALLDPSTAPSALRTIVIGGEVCAPAVVRRWAARVRVVNVYGPTECTVCSSLCACDPVAWTRPLLGAPIAGTVFRLLDAQGEPPARGAPCELYIGGEGLALGYHARDALTRARFVTVRGERLFRTGDLVRETDDGALEFVGRVDRQLKVRGQLVAPEEIEARLAEHPRVREAAVVLEDGALVGCVAGPVPVDDAELRAHLSRTLPGYMVPARFEWRDALPRSSSGKLDVRALAVEIARPIERDTISYDRATEIAAVFARALGRRAVGPDEAFADLGGDSLALLRAAAMGEARGLGLSPALIAREQTAARVARALDASGDAHGAMDAAALREDAAGLLATLPAVGSSSEGARTALVLTGATGFLGARLLHELLALAPALEVRCVVRARDAAHGRERLASALAVHGLALPPRVEVIPCDLAHAPPGLARGAFAVVHCAARVNMVRPYAALREDNVLGTRDALALAANATLHFASTLSVFVGSDRHAGAMLETDALDAARTLHGGYAQSKWAAEWLVRASRRPAVIYRLGLITGDSRTGASSGRDQLAMFFRGLALLGCVPDALEHAALAVDITPVDFAARAMARLVLDPDASGTYHLAAPHAASAWDLVEALRDAGARIETVSPSQWRARARDAGLDASAAFLGLCRALGEPAAFDRQRAADLFAASGARFGTERASAALLPHGIACPPATRALLGAYAARALEAR